MIFVLAHIFRKFQHVPQQIQWIAQRILSYNKPYENSYNQVFVVASSMLRCFNMFPQNISYSIQTRNRFYDEHGVISHPWSSMFYTSLVLTGWIPYIACNNLTLGAHDELPKKSLVLAHLLMLKVFNSLISIFNIIEVFVEFLAFQECLSGNFSLGKARSPPIIMVIRYNETHWWTKLSQ